jgi:hypothetical protein
VSFAYPFTANPYVFYTGNTSGSATIPFTITLDDHVYPIDVTQYKASSLASLNQNMVNTGQVDDSLFNADGAWWRYRHDWRYGAGQSVMDLGEDRNTSRFYKSVGINPWTEGQLKLHHSTTLTNSTVKDTNVMFAVTESHIYAMDATRLHRSSDGITWVTCTLSGTPGTLTSITSDGINCYIGTSTNVYVSNTSTATLAVFTTVSASFTGVWFAAGKLMAAKANVLSQISGAGVFDTTNQITHFQASFKWTTVFNAGSKIYAGGYAGLRSEVVAFTISSTGVLVQGAESISFSYGELVQTAIGHAGVVIFGTNKGIRLADISQFGIMTYGPLIDTPGSVTSIQGEAQYVWFNWSNFDSAATGAGRLDLSATPRQLQPAFATDVYAGVSSICSGIARFGGKTIVGIIGYGIYTENLTTYVSSGYVDSGNIFFGTVELKSITDVLATFAPLAINEKVFVEVFDSNGELLNSSSSNSIESEKIIVGLDGEQADYFTTRITLYSSTSGTTTPTFKRWRLRAFPIVPPLEQYILPLMLFSSVVINDAQGQLMSVHVDEEVEFLKEIWYTKRPISYVQGKTVRRVRIEAYEYSPEIWSPNDQGFEGTLTVRLVTI